MKLLGLLVFLIASVCVGQGFPELIKPDPTTGRPLLVSTPCTTEPTWAIPIVVYEDSETAIFVDQNCLDTSVDTGFEQSGKYMVALYRYYKGTLGFCKFHNIPITPKSEGMCKLFGYKIRVINVDTRARKLAILRAMAVDTRGTFLDSFSIPPAKQYSTAECGDSPPLERLDCGTTSAVERTTKLVEKELGYWKQRLQRH